jgi:hypothetical protein
MAHSWNCSSGFVEITPQIARLSQGKQKFLSLASSNDGEAYIQFDRGLGSEIEQWSVPKTVQDSWMMSGVVPTKIV